MLQGDAARRAVLFVEKPSMGARDRLTELAIDAKPSEIREVFAVVARSIAGDGRGDSEPR